MPRRLLRFALQHRRSEYSTAYSRVRGGAALARASRALRRTIEAHLA